MISFRRTRLVVRAAAVAGASMFVTFGAPWSSPASAHAAAEVVVVGDSITADNAGRIGAHLRSEVAPSVHLEALAARRIEVSYEWHGWRSSGLDAIERVHAAGIDPELWVIELGTNDAFHFVDQTWAEKVESAGELIDAVVDAVGPGESIAWVTVLNREDAIASRTFNQALRDRAVANEQFALIDWEHEAIVHPEWFIDLVHPNDVGAGALAGLYAAEIDRRLGVS